MKQQSLIADEPSLSIIIAVRNEQENLEKALTSVCNINYKNHRVIVINDRSTDGTQLILEQVMKEHPEILIEQVTELPPNWLGKNHALYRGYQRSTSDWLLFTDADIVFHPDAVKKAMSYVFKYNLDHLTIFPDVKSRSAILNSILETFSVMLVLKLKPWEASVQSSQSSIGIGAFNLVKRIAYEKAGTHINISLRPDDDLKLGEIIKANGLKQDVLYGDDQIQLEWYPNVKEFINGLMKNTFSVSDYKVTKAVSAAILTFLIFCLPIPAGLLLGTPVIKCIALLIMLVQAGLFYGKPGKAKWWYFLMITYAGGLMAYIICKSTWLVCKNGGIYWRDSFYALNDLKSQ